MHAKLYLIHSITLTQNVNFPFLLSTSPFYHKQYFTHFIEIISDQLVPNRFLRM